jgi:hypothetical protein
MMINREKIKELEKELMKQKAIFDKHAPKVINPDNTPAYKTAKKKFDAAYKRMGEIEKEIEQLKNPRPKPQTQPSQHKVKSQP